MKEINHIAHYRIRKGLTQDELGKKIGVSGTTISNWEVGIRGVKASALKKLSQVLEVSIDDLLGV